ncbi:helix-turn-helix domain-containing protein [Candidatus Dependentiae bacterium]|nr:helix-turn-helix domain-containing protein [Candidatus Dependentiae bacterium]
MSNRYRTNPHFLLSRCHILDYLEKKGEDGARQVEIAKKFGVNSGTVYNHLVKLKVTGFVKRSKKHSPKSNRPTYYYFLTNYARRKKREFGLRSWLQKENNPYYETFKKIAKRMEDGLRMKDKFIPRKKIEGFKGRDY